MEIVWILKIYVQFYPIGHKLHWHYFETGFKTKRFRTKLSASSCFHKTNCRSRELYWCALRIIPSVTLGRPPTPRLQTPTHTLYARPRQVRSAYHLWYTTVLSSSNWSLRSRWVLNTQQQCSHPRFSSAKWSHFQFHFLRRVGCGRSFLSGTLWFFTIYLFRNELLCYVFGVSRLV